MAGRVRDLGILDQASSLLAYIATDCELPACGIVDLARDRSIPVGLPATGDSPRFLRHRRGVPLVGNSWGIPQPASDEEIEPGANSVVVLPLVACGPTGIRLGRGGGWYDRVAATWPATTLRVGIGFDFQAVENVPRDDWDVPLHMLVTDRRIVSWLDSGPFELPGKEGSDRDGSIPTDCGDRRRVDGGIRLVNRQAAKPAA